MYFEGDLQRGADNVGCLWLHLYQVRLYFGSATDCLFLSCLLLILCIFLFFLLQHCVDNIWSSTIVRLLEGDSVVLPEILITRKTLPAALSQSVNVNQWTLGLFLTQTWIHPHLFPYLLPFIQVACIIRKAFARILHILFQISLNGSIWSTVSVTVSKTLTSTLVLILIRLSS